MPAFGAEPFQPCWTPAPTPIQTRFTSPAIPWDPQDHCASLHPIRFYLAQVQVLLPGELPAGRTALDCTAVPKVRLQAVCSVQKHGKAFSLVVGQVVVYINASYPAVDKPEQKGTHGPRLTSTAGCDIPCVRWQHCLHCSTSQSVCSMARHTRCAAPAALLL